MISEVGAENNSTTVLMIPSDFVTLSRSLSDYLQEHGRRDVGTPSAEKPGDTGNVAA
jgi:hypothetical protein